MKGQKKLPQPNVTADTLREAKLRSAMTDMVRGGLLGATTDAVGYLPDAVADFMRPFGYNVAPQDVVGGTEWLANKFTTPTNSTPEKAARFVTGMMTPSPMDFARLGKGPMQELTVYHGSPHRINNVDEANPMGRFDLSKVGTGEGAQAYGHGIYLAENPGVARSYVTTPRINQAQAFADLGADISGDSNAQGALRQFTIAAQNGLPWDRAAKNAQYRSAILRDVPIDKLTKSMQQWAEESTGSFYTVDLPDSHIAKMLDWDAPLSEQPEAVRKALASRLVEYQYNIAGKRLATVTGDPLVGIKLQGALKKNGGDINAAFDELGKLGNESWKQSLAKARAEVDWSSISVGKVGKAGNGSALYADLAKEFGGDAKASEYLRSLGIPGIKYFDGGSRSAGEGTRNFVIFDGDTAKILKRE
jgi:hypothetical protein